ncbi:hypothetical protein [Marinactinospora rubrisoli]|uniref:Uncharacterized protein n=1 Tax=Marinactinospora rubrisoli TaxID=2715399 RepID=A0ABW2KGM0_9ACTN
MPGEVAGDKPGDGVRAALEEPPPDGGTHWPTRMTRMMAARPGLGQTAVSRIWRAFGRKPHLVDGWQLSSDPFFIEKVRDVTGPCLILPIRRRCRAWTRDPGSRP